MEKLLLFDLDGTLLNSDKKISKANLTALRKCRERGYLIGISTSRSEQNCLSFLEELNPDILITSGGALIKKNNEYIYKALFSEERTNEIIDIVRRICGFDCEITVDTVDKHYWNYKSDTLNTNETWGESSWTDYSNFKEEALKICVEIFDDNIANKLKEALDDCDCVRFSDGYWYKFTKKGVTKEDSIRLVCESFYISADEIIAFGDDYSDIGMLKISGIGVAMGNAVDDVKKIADVVIGRNDEDGIAEYLNYYTKPLSFSGLSESKFNKEMLKAHNDFENGRVYSFEEVENELRKEPVQ